MQPSLLLSLSLAPFLALGVPGTDVAPALLWQDFDGDGLADLLSIDGSGSVRLHRNLGAGRLEDVTQFSGLEVTSVRSASWQDVDGDGAQDLLFIKRDGSSALFRSSAAGRFEDVTEQSGLARSPGASRARWVDFDQDGHADLELFTEDGALLLHNDGQGFLHTTSFELRPAPLAGAVVAGAPPQVLGTEPDDSSHGPEAGGGQPASSVEVTRVTSVGTSGAPVGTIAPGGIAPSAYTAQCSLGVSDDANPGSCMGASSEPTLGMLYPMSPDLFVDSDGRVGMNTLDPQALLHIKGGADEASLRLSTKLANGTSKVTLLENNNGESGLTGGQLAYDGVNDRLELSTLGAGQESVRMVIERTTGDVGIGIQDPEAHLHIVGGPQLGSVIIAPNAPLADKDSELILSESSLGALGMKLSYNGSKDRLAFRGVLADGTSPTHMIINRDDGKVGINDLDPGGQLEVHGDEAESANATFRAVNTHSLNGVAIYAQADGFGVPLEINQRGSGPILRGQVDGETLFWVNGNGRVFTTALQITGGGDLVEGFDGDESLEPGTVVAIDTQSPGSVTATRSSYDAKVAGVVSGAGGVNHGVRMGQDGVLDGDTLVAMAGRVYVRCSAENGAIEPGDLLTSASLAGHAMKATDTQRAFGAVIGKALTPLDDETGLVLVLVNLQ